jgi:3-phenylpropionate/trans-cinnamate dioxygenase ferredoxin reductase subunit
MPATVVAIIGAGQAGFQAAASLRDAGFAGRIVLVGDEPALPYQRPPLSKSYLAGQSGADDLWLRPAEFYAKQQIDLIYGDAVTAIDRRRQRLYLASGIEFSWDHLLFATGAGCRPLAVPGAELDGVLTLRTLADADALRQRLEEAREVVVVGAGFIGLEFAAVALARGTAVHIVEVTHKPMGRVVSEPVSRFFTDAHMGWGAEVALGTGVVRILGDGGRVAGVETTERRSISADLILICIGVIPNAVHARKTGLAIDHVIDFEE